MIVSEARILANRANAARSTGPRTAEGKESSRCNAVKHGLTGQGVAIRPVEAEAVEIRFAGLRADYRPVTEAGLALLRRASVLSIRLDRSAVQEAAAISRNIGTAEVDFDEAREAEVDRLFASIGEEPAATLRKLLRMPEGVDRMVATWADLFDDLAHDDGSRWTADHSAMALALTGRKAGGFGIARVEALARAVLGDFSLLGAEDGPGLDDGSRREWAREALASVIEAAVANLEAHRATIDLDRIEADRARAADLALFDPSKAACLARKHEAAAERGMFRAIREMKAIEAEVASRGGPSSALPASSTVPVAGGMGSFSPPAPARVVATPPIAPKAAPGARPEPRSDSTYVPITAGRPGSGSR